MENNGVNLTALLQDAALKGDVTVLKGLLGRDPLLLHKTSNIYPLHIASKLGHLQFTQELLRRNPSLAEELDPADRSSPLHLASGNGHAELVRTLVSTNAYMCLARDVHGRNPAHVAAMKGYVDVLEELLRAVPAAARERVGGGDGIGHLCVKFDRLEALRLVARTAGDAGMLLNATDGDGNSILHIAVADKQLQIVRFLLNDSRVEKNKPNLNGLTAMDISIQYNNNEGQELSFLLQEAKLLTSHDIKKEKQKARNLGWVKNQQNALMVVASLIATMAFQAGLSPPGGVWQDNNAAHRAGWAILAETDATRYKRFVTLNTFALVSSMSSILVLVSGLLKERFLIAFIMVMMSASVSAMTWSYGIALLVMSPYETVVVVQRVFLITCFVVAGKLLALLLLEKLSCLMKKVSSQVVLLKAIYTLVFGHMVYMDI